MRFWTELIHNLPVAMFERDMGDGDVWFLNHHARVYFEQCNVALSPLYAAHFGLIRELFALVPEALRGKLEWAGPPLGTV